MGFALWKLRQDHNHPSRCQSDCNRCKPGGASCTLCPAAQHPPVEQGQWERHHCCTDTPFPCYGGKVKQWHAGQSPGGLTMSKLSSHWQGEALGISPWDSSSSSLHLMGDGAKRSALCKPGALCSIKSLMEQSPGSGIAHCSLFQSLHAS